MLSLDAARGSAVSVSRSFSRKQEKQQWNVALSFCSGSLKLPKEFCFTVAIKPAVL